MASSQNFAFLSPLQTLNNFNTGQFLDNKSALETIWLILCQLDVDSISDSELEHIASFWCRSVMLANVYNLTMKPKPTKTLYLSYLLLTKVSFSLFKRLQAIEKPPLEPILVLCCLSDDIFNDCPTPSNFPIKLSPIFNQPYPVIEYFRQHSETPRYFEIVHWALRFFTQNDEKSKEILKDFIDQDSNYFISSDITEFIDSFTIDKEIPIQSVLLIRYSLNKILDENIQPPINCPDMYPKLFKKFLSTEITTEVKIKLCQTFIFIRGEKVDLPNELLTSENASSALLTIIFLSQQINDFDIYKVFEFQPKLRSSMLLLLPHVKCVEDFNKLHDFLLEKKYPESWTNEMKTYLLIKDPVDKLIQQSLNGEIEAAQLLLDIDCLPFLTPDKSIYHHIISILLADEVPPFPENPETTNATAAIIFKSLQRKVNLDLNALITATHKYLTEQIEKVAKTKYLTHLIFAGFSLSDIPSNYRLIIPQESKDIVVDLTKDPISLIFLNIYMILYAINETKQKCDETLIADFALNFFYANELKPFCLSILSQTFDEVLMKQKNFHILQAFAEKAERSKVLEIIKSYITNNFELISKLSLFFVNDSDLGSLISLLAIAPMSIPFIISTLTEEVQQKILESLIEKADNDHLRRIVPQLVLGNASLFKYLGEIAQKSPKLITPLLSVCDFADEYFLSAISTFSGEITPEFAQLLKKLVRTLPMFPCAQQRNDETRAPRMRVCWGQPPADVRVDPWEAPASIGAAHCEGENLMFFCYTCGISGENKVCLNCALKCHQNHDITLYKACSSPCCCANCSLNKAATPNANANENGSNNEKKVNSNQTNEDKNVTTEDKKENKEENKENVPDYAQVLYKLFTSLTNCEIQKPPNPLQLNRLTLPITDIDILKLKCTIVPTKLKLAPTQSPKLIDMQILTSEISNRINIQHFMRRSSACPMLTAVVGGPLSDILVVCSGTSLTSYNVNSMQKMGSFTMVNPGFQITFCPLDPTIFAVASMYHVMIFSISEDGSIQESDEIELMLDSIGPHIFVDFVVWVPLAALQLAVVCNSFIKIYDVPTDRFSPIACFTVDQPDYFSSACFVEYISAEEEECMGLFALSTGRIAIQSCNVDSSDGAIPLTRFAALPKFESNITLSYCAESNLLFISSQQGLLIIMRLEEIFSEHPKYLSIDLKEYAISLYFIYCTNALHFFISPLTGVVVTIEFTDLGIEISSFTSKIPNNNLPLFDRTIINLTVFEMKGEFHGIGQSGRLLSLQSADVNDDVEEDDSEEENENDTYTVPASFWSNLVISKNAVEMSAPAVSGDCAALLSGNHFVFPGQMLRKVIDISLQDDNNLILGFRVSVGSGSSKHRPPFVRLFGRKFNISTQRSVCIPLKPEEVGSRRHYKLVFGNNNNNDISIDAVDVFVLPYERISKKYSILSREFDWMKDGMDIFDFADSLLGRQKSSNSIIDLIDQVSQALPPYFEADDAMVETLANLIYVRPDVALAARRVLIKGSLSGDDNTLKIWTKVISKLVEEKKIHEKQWSLLWRDVALLPQKYRDELTPKIWKSNPQIAGTFSVITAFFTE